MSIQKPWNVPDDLDFLAFKLIVASKKVNFYDFYYYFVFCKNWRLALEKYNCDKHEKFRLSYSEAMMLLYILDFD